MKKVIIWGTGMVYDHCLSLIRYFEEKGQFRVEGVTSDDRYFEYLDGYRLIPKKELSNTEYDYIIVCAAKETAAKIKKEAASLNISEDVLIFSNVIIEPYFDFVKHEELLRSKISIFSNTVWGSSAYENLGLKIRSPFCGMYENDREFVSFLKNAEEILKNNRIKYLKMSFSETDKFYPVYELGGMKLYMNGHKSREEAEEKWNERLGEINWDNIFAMICSDDIECIEEFSQLPYKKKICFTSLDVSIPYTYRVPDGGDPYLFVQNISGKYGSRYYDLTELLLSGKVVNRRIKDFIVR